jgi:hypothetical protein
MVFKPIKKIVSEPMAVRSPATNEVTTLWHLVKQQRQQCVERCVRNLQQNLGESAEDASCPLIDTSGRKKDTSGLLIDISFLSGQITAHRYIYQSSPLIHSPPAHQKQIRRKIYTRVKVIR